LDILTAPPKNKKRRTRKKPPALQTGHPSGVNGVLPCSYLNHFRLSSCQQDVGNHMGFSPVLTQAGELPNWSPNGKPDRARRVSKTMQP
jgi:hypothetical protein